MLAYTSPIMVNDKKAFRGGHGRPWICASAPNIAAPIMKRNASKLAVSMPFAYAMLAHKAMEPKPMADRAINNEPENLEKKSDILLVM